VLVGQHRFPLENYSWESPKAAGPKTSRRSKPPSASSRGGGPARRRLAAGAGGGALQFVSDEIAFGYIALGLTPTELEPDETEALTLRRVPFAEALDLALSA
jgi:hypothetical protein